MGRVFARTALVAVLVSVSVAACGSEATSPVPDGTATQPATESGPAQPGATARTQPTVPPAEPGGEDPDADRLFIAGLEGGGVEFADPETMAILGRGICAELRQGRPVIEEVDAVTTGSGGKWDESAAGAIIGSSIGAYCPEFRALLPP